MVKHEGRGRVAKKKEVIFYYIYFSFSVFCLGNLGGLDWLPEFVLDNVC